MNFLRTLWYILEERLDAVRRAIQSEWHYHSLRARIWRDEKKLPEVVDQETYDHANFLMAPILDDYEMLEAMHTSKLERLAKRYGHPMPSKEGTQFYRRVQYDIDHSQPYYLTNAGKEEFRQTLHKIRKERREAAGFWVALTVGVIGSITGLVSVLNNS